MTLPAAIDRLEEWYVRKALPLWAHAGVDAHGAFYESLDFDGRPIPGPRRVRVQCRQIHTFTQAALKEWLPAGEAIAARGFARLLDTACPDDAARGCVHLLDDGGAVVDATRDLYDQAFLLLACASRIEAGQERARGIAEKTLAFLDREMASPHGGFFENDRRSLPRRQNPHMHLFEALMALNAATGDVAYLGRARAIEGLFEAKFFDRQAGVLREFFDNGWAPNIDRGGEIEPGHMMEWVFLLDRFDQLADETRSSEKRALYAAAKATVADRPFLPNAATVGSPPQRSARRLWPQTEYLRAALVLGEHADAASLIDALFATCLDQKTPGLWMDEYDAASRPIANDVPASILYHLHEAVSFAVDCRHKLSP